MLLRGEWFLREPLVIWVLTEHINFYMEYLEDMRILC